jgi:hypothetical protein
MPRIKAKSLVEVFDVNWEGLDNVIAGINKEIDLMEGRTVQGLLEAALRVKKDAIILAPVDTGNLRNSAYVLWGVKGAAQGGQASGSFKPDKRSKIDPEAQHSSVIAERKSLGKKSADPYAEIGFTAHYALDVHENTDLNHPAGQAKFFEDALLQNRETIFAIIKKRALG